MACDSGRDKLTLILVALVQLFITPENIPVDKSAKKKEEQYGDDMKIRLQKKPPLRNTVKLLLSNVSEATHLLFVEVFLNIDRLHLVLARLFIHLEYDRSGAVWKCNKA